MDSLISVAEGMLVVFVIYWTNRLFPKWFGGIYNLAFLLFMVYTIITRGQDQLISMLIVLILGEVILGGIWVSAREDKKRKIKKEIEKMKATDISHNN